MGTTNRLKTKLLFFVIIVFFKNILSANSDAINFYPLYLGNHWDYTSNLYPVSFEITDTTTINGLLYYGLSMWSGSEPEYWIRNDENIIYMFNIEDNKDYILFNHFINPLP